MRASRTGLSGRRLLWWWIRPIGVSRHWLRASGGLSNSSPYCPLGQGWQCRRWMMPTVVIASYNVAAFPEGGGHVGVYLQYVLAFRQLGWDVYWLEAFRSKGRVQEETAALDTFRTRIKRYGLGGKCILYLTQ